MIEVAEYFVVLALEKLVSDGRIFPDDVNHKWYVSFDDKSLTSNRFAGGATIDRQGRAVIYFHKDLTIEGLMHVAAHEAVHLAQICCGDMTPQYGTTIWKDKEYGNLAAEHPDYANQPWEAEAFSLESSIFNYIKSKAPPVPSAT